MKTIKKIITILSVCFIMFSLLGNSSSAATIEDSKKVTISESDFVLTKIEKIAVKNFGEQLSNTLKATKASNYDTVITNFLSENKNPLETKLTSILEEKVKEQKNNKMLKTGDQNVSLEIDPNLKQALTQVYNINENDVLIISPTHIEISKLEQSKLENDDMNILATSTISGTATHTMYNNFGNKLMTINVTSKFNYNGSKATYHSGFDYWYNRGFLSIWQVSNWRGWHEASGTSYQARASGDFHMGLEVQGIGLVIEDYYIRVTLKCDKNGNLSRTHYYG